MNATGLNSVIDLLLDAVCIVDADGHFVFVSAASESIFGYTPQEMIGRRMIDMVVPEDRERTLQAAGRIMAGDAHLHFENRYLRKDGRTVDVMWSARRAPDGRSRVAVARDITSHKRALRLQEATYAISEAAHAAVDMDALFARIHRIIALQLAVGGVAVALLDEDHAQLRFPYCAHAHETEQVEPSAALRTLCHDTIHDAQMHLVRGDRGDAPQLEQTPPCAESTSWLGAPLRSNGTVIGVLALMSHPDSPPFDDDDRSFLRYVSTQVATAIERRRLHAGLKRMAQRDALTGLPNRRLLDDRLDSALKRARREGCSLSLLFVDLDDFKRVNDTLGHAAGDLLLRSVAQRLTACVRDADTVARIGGDEFVVLLDSEPRGGGDQGVIERIASAFHEPFVIDGQMLRIQASVGAAHYPEHGQDAAQLLRHADAAMYSLKRGI